MPDSEENGLVPANPGDFLIKRENGENNNNLKKYEIDKRAEVITERTNKEYQAAKHSECQKTCRSFCTKTAIVIITLSFFLTAIIILILILDFTK